MLDEKNNGYASESDGMISLIDELFGDALGSFVPKKAKGVDNGVLFIGKYQCRLKDGSIALPVDCIKVWALAEFEDDVPGNGEKFIFLADEESRCQDEDIRIIECGECEFDENGAWVAPAKVIALLDSESLILVGLGNYAELMTEKSWQEKEVYPDL